MSEPSVLDLVIGLDGAVSCIYGELLDLRQISTLSITRASHVEPDADGHWWADMGPSGRPVLGPDGSRSEPLAAEREGWPGVGGNARVKQRDGLRRLHYKVCRNARPLQRMVRSILRHGLASPDGIARSFVGSLAKPILNAPY